jgi:hypothetical protein
VTAHAITLLLSSLGPLYILPWFLKTASTPLPPPLVLESNLRGRFIECQGECVASSDFQRLRPCARRDPPCAPPDGPPYVWAVGDEGNIGASK